MCTNIRLTVPVIYFGGSGLVISCDSHRRGGERRGGGATAVGALHVHGAMEEQPHSQSQPEEGRGFAGGGQHQQPYRGRGGGRAHDADRRLYIGQLPPGTPREKLEELCAPFGKVEVSIPGALPGDVPRNFAFASFETKEKAKVRPVNSAPSSSSSISSLNFFAILLYGLQEAMEALHSRVFEGFTLKVNFADSSGRRSYQRDGRGFGGGYRQHGRPDQSRGNRDYAAASSDAPPSRDRLDYDRGSGSWGGAREPDLDRHHHPRSDSRDRGRTDSSYEFHPAREYERGGGSRNGRVYEAHEPAPSSAYVEPPAQQSKAEYRSILVRNLADKCSDAMLNSIFERCGSIEAIERGRVPGEAIIRYGDPFGVDNAVHFYHNVELGGNFLDVSMALPPPTRPSRPVDSGRDQPPRRSRSRSRDRYTGHSHQNRGGFHPQMNERRGGYGGGGGGGGYRRS
jgi:RNA recognition motif-containing protein